MKHLYAKMTFRIILISFLALTLIGCGEDSAPGGAPGQTAVISLNLQTDSLPADGYSSTPIAVLLTDSSGNPVDMGTSVKLSTTIGTFPNGEKEYHSSTVDDSGVIAISLIAETQTGDAVVTALSNNITQKISISFTESGIATPVFLTLGASTNIVKSDNSDSAEITAVVLDADRAPITGVTVFFSTTSEDGTAGAGQISASSLVTDENGEAIVLFSAGVGDKRNQIVTIEASVDVLGSKQIPIQVTGSYLMVSAEGETNIEINDNSVIKVAVFDASNAPVFDAPVSLSLMPDSTGSVFFTPATGKTDINGEFLSTVTGIGVGTAVVQAESLGAMGMQTYTVDDPNKAFRIIEPDSDVTGLSTGEDLEVTVLSPGYSKVVFAATIGTWDGSPQKVIEKTVINGQVSAVFTSVDAGTSTIQVYPVSDPLITDAMKVAISAPSSEASQIFFQSSATVVSPSTQDVKNSVTLIAKVSNASNQVVSGAPVLFSIITPSGGGEYVSPAIAFSNSSGIATSVFTSGSLVAGAAGVQIKAELINVDVSDTVSIIISGRAASLSIGRSTELESINDDTAYRMPMSVLVVDANGSPVKQSAVYLNLWPSSYMTGYWETRKTVTASGKIVTYCVPIVEEERLNEDVNKNLIIDEGEDINQDGFLTPPSSAGGAIPESVVTDENGVASFDLIYMKSSAVWIRDAITASTVVSGTETLSSFSFVLPWTIEDANNCALPGSPYIVKEEEPVVGSVSDITAGLSTIVADGNSTTVIRATVLDTNGEPFSGQNVVFTTTLGSFIGDSTVMTGESGVATITLKSSTSPGTAIVTANADGFTDQLEVTMTASEPDSISITAIPNSVVPGGSVTVIASLTDEFGNPVADESLNFQITQNNTGGSLSSASSTSDVNGQATMTYTAGAIEGVDRIKVTLNSNQSIFATVSIQVEQSDFLVGSILLTSALESIPADDSSSTAITATVLDSAGEPVPMGTVITFSTTLGRLPGGGSVISRQTADDSGVVVISLTAGTSAGTAVVTANCLGVSQSITIEITGSGGGVLVGTIDVRIVDTVLDADGTSNTEVIATVKTVDNQAIEGAEVTFETTGGSITSPHVTDSNGQAIAVITSDRWNREGANRVEVTARSQLVFDTATMSFSGVTIVLTAVPDNLLTTETSIIFATLLDAADRPIADEVVVFTTTRGTITPTATTNSSGIAGVTTTSSLSGTATVEASSRNATGTTSITYGSYRMEFVNPDDTDPYYPDLNPEPISVGGGTKDLTIGLFDFGAPGVLDGETIYFSTSLGSVSPSSVVTAGPVAIPPPSHASATTTLTSGGQTGQAVIDAFVTLSGDGTVLTAQTTVLILADTATKIVLTPDPGIISVNNGVATIRAIVYDADDNPVPFQNVYFRINNAPGGGEYLTSSVAETNISGIAEVEFYAGGIPSITIDDIEIEASTDPAFPPPPMGLCNLTIAGPVAAISVSVNLQELIAPVLETGHLEVGVSAIATDINGNPVADGTQIYFGVSSIAFDEDRDFDFTIDCFDDPDQVNSIACPGAGILGIDWFSDDVNDDGNMYQTGGIMSPSEDAVSNGGNANGILDLGEDKNGNGVMDPVQGCTIESPKGTVSGIASATLNYPMSFANNIKVRLTAEAGGVSNFYDYILLCTEDMVDNGTCGLGY